MNRIACLLATLAMVACNGDGGDSGAVAGCGVELKNPASFPANDATDVYYRSSIEWFLDKADISAVASLTDASGNPVDGTSMLDIDSNAVYFVPSSPLSPSTDYNASLTFCAGSESISFRTSELGGAVDQTSLVGKTYNLDLADARFVKPAGVADLLLVQLESSVLLGVTDVVEDTSIKMVGAVSEAGAATQDHCKKSIDFPTTPFTSAPFFSIGPQDTALPVAGSDLLVSNLVVSGTFAPDGSYFGGGMLVGELDGRELAPTIGEMMGQPDADGDYVCALMASFQVSCVPCASDGAQYCIELLADNITAAAVPGATLDEVLLSDCDPECEVVADDCDTSTW